MNKKIQKILYVLFIIFILILICNNCFALTPKIVNKLSSAFENIEKWMLKLSTPATAVAVAVGLFMKNLVLVMKKESEFLKK